MDVQSIEMIGLRILLYVTRGECPDLMLNHIVFFFAPRNAPGAHEKLLFLSKTTER